MPLQTRKKPRRLLSSRTTKPVDPRPRPANRRGVSGGGSVFLRRRKSPVVVRRAVLFALLVIGLALLTVSYRDDGSFLRGPQMQVLRVVAPIEHGLTRAWQPVQGAYDWVAALLRATGENPELRDKVEYLEGMQAAQQVLEQENNRLREILAMRERGSFPKGHEAVVARVIARSPTAIDRSVVIGAGSDDGLRVDDPVMVARGLIGRVKAVSSNAARVALIVNSSEAVSATVVQSGASGVLRSTTNEGSPVLELAYVSQRVKVDVGDLVATSGWSSGELESKYPRGIPLGIVTSVGNSPADLYKKVQVTPFGDFDRIHEVIVLTSDKKAEKPVMP